MSNSKDKASPYPDMVQKILSGLAKVRMDAGSWIDSESEELGRETQVFKIGECLRPFYLAAQRDFGQFNQAILPRELLAKETEFFFKQVDKNGFFPSPYSPIPEAKDQYTDFAAFVLDFSSLVHDYWKGKSTHSSRAANLSKTLAEKAFNFLLTPANYLSDESGCRWGGTNKYSRVKRAKEFYTNTYFTSVVILALHSTLESPVLNLSSARQDEVRNIIRQAGKWITSRFDGEFITGDEAKTNRQLIHTTWGLRALVETYHTQEKEVRQRLIPIVSAYLDELRTRRDFTLEQEYLTILSDEVDAPLYYEDRSGLGGILLTLACLRDIPELERLLEDASYPLLLERVSSAVIALRNPSLGLWYSQQLILSIHSYLTEAFLTLAHRGRGFGSKIEVSGYMIRNAVRETFADETIITSLQQSVYDRLLRLVETVGQERTLQEGMNKLLAPSNKRDTTQDKRSRTTRARTGSAKRPSRKR